MTKGSKNLLFPLLVVALGLAALAATAFLVTPAQGPRRTGVAAIGGPFTMTGQDGRIVTEADFKGRPALVFFGYTHCPDVCPTTLFEISELFKAMGPDKKVSAVFVTTDPERDTPAVMKDYLSSFDTRIVGLSGTPEQTTAIEKSYKVYAKKVPGETGGDYTMDHTAIVYLMDKDGRFVSAFNLDRPPQEAAKELEKYL